MVSPPETFEYDAKVKYFLSKNNAPPKSTDRDN